MKLVVEKLGRDLEGTTHIDMLIYGRSGAGKTYRAATAPRPMYVISSDPTGHKSIPFPVDGRIIRSIQDIREVHQGITAGGHGYKTLVVDGLSFIHDLFVKEIGQYYHEEMGARDPDIMPLQGRLKISNSFRNLIRALVDLTQINPPENRIHVVFTTLSERLKEDDKAPFQIRPLFGTQKMNESYPMFFSVIGYIEPVGGEDEKGELDPSRYMLFAEQNGVLARDRLGIFPLKGIAPNLSQYFERKGEE